eukprot:TCONS_00025229-protein
MKDRAAAAYIFVFFMVNIVLSDAADEMEKNETKSGDLPILCPQCDPNWTPFPNMVSGLVGYNIVSSDPLVTAADPGMGNQIFAPTKYIDGTVYLDDSITAFELSNCQRSMSIKSWTNLNQMSSSLEETSTSGYNLQLGYDSKVTAGVEGLDLSSDIPAPFTMGWSNSKTMKNAASSFSEEQGMVAFTHGMCIQYEMKLSAYYLPEFMPPFVMAIGELHDASSQSTNEQENAFKKFVNEFGTHYMIHSELGALFAQQTTYSGTVRQNMDHEALQQCNSKQAVKIFGVQTAPDTSKCTDTAEETLNSYSQNDVKQVTITKGSRPTDIADWATQDFTPTPLRYQFSPIVNIFQDNFIEKRNIQNSDGQPVDSLKLRQWFMPLYDKYCEVLGFKCSMAKGCGFDDNCPVDTVCEGEGETHECGEWGEWGSWACSDCGVSLQKKRTRECTGCKGDEEQIKYSEDPTDCCNVLHKVYVRVSLYENADAGSKYEPYGDMKISIGDRSENQNKPAWHVTRDHCPSYKLSTWYRGPDKYIEFYEHFDFLKSDGNIFKLHGHAWEADSNPDDLIAKFDGFQDDVKKYLDYDWIHFNGKHGNGNEEGEVKIKFYKV